MMRQIGKQMLTILAWMVLASLAQAESLVTTVVTDPLTGIAMDGYDPVSYFTDPDPQEGKPDFEYVWQGVPWYFESAANRDVFQRSPEVYAPQFGGHCPMSLSLGYLSDGVTLPAVLFGGEGNDIFTVYSNHADLRLAQHEAAADRIEFLAVQRFAAVAECRDTHAIRVARKHLVLEPKKVQGLVELDLVPAEQAQAL